MIDCGIALTLAGPVLALILFVIGILKASPYQKSGRISYAMIYKPFKMWGLLIWIGFTIAGLAVMISA